MLMRSAKNIDNDSSIHIQLIINIENYILPAFKANTILDLLNKLGKDNFKSLFIKAAKK
jgi:hypothetical protein